MMDGDFDYTQLSRTQLEEALTRVDKRRYPVNYRRILKELERRPPEPSAVQSVEPPPLASLIGWYSIGLVVAYLLAYMSAGFVVFAVTAVLRTNGGVLDAPIPPLIDSVLKIVAPLVLYLRLARKHPLEFLRAATGIAIVASAVLAAIACISADSKVPSPVRVFVTILFLNFTVASLMGTLIATGRLKPTNHRLDKP